MKERILTKSQSEIEPRTCNLCQARENIDAALTVIGRLVSVGKCRKAILMVVRLIGFRFAPN